MSPSLMDTGDERSSPCSLSAECNSNTAGSEREGEGQQEGNTGTKRRVKNRDAARRTRRKQTQRADELHEELQCLEQANAAFQKEIAALKKDFDHYTEVLAHHEPYCLLRASASTKGSALSSLGGGQTTSSPPPNLPQASGSILATPLSASTSLTSSLVHQTLAPTVTTLLSTTDLASHSADLPLLLPYSALAPPHSLFSKALTTPRPANVTPVLSHLHSTSMTSSALTTAAQSPSFPTFDFGSFDEFLASSSLSAPSNAGPSYPNLTREGLETRGCPLNVPQLHSGQYSGDPNTLHSPTVSRPAPACYRQTTPSPGSLLSLLTVPSPLNTSQTTSSSDGLLVQPLPPSLGDPSTDLSLSEFLEGNDWILSGTSDH